jgi:hypothetical protein
MFPFSNSVWKPCGYYAFTLYDSVVYFKDFLVPAERFTFTGKGSCRMETHKWTEGVTGLLSFRQMLHKDRNYCSPCLLRDELPACFYKECHSLCKRHCIMVSSLILEIGCKRCSCWYWHALFGSMCHRPCFCTVRFKQQSKIAVSCKLRRHFAVTVLIF